jgi:hypothetical protein
LLGALTAVACGSDDDSGSPGGGGASAGSSGKGNGKAGGSNVGGADGENAGAGGAAGDMGQAGGNVGVAGGGGTGGTGGACTDFTVFVHSVIKDDTTEKSAPRPVNGVVFCPDPADPAAYKDLF